MKKFVITNVKKGDKPIPKSASAALVDLIESMLKTKLAKSIDRTKNRP